MILKDFLNDDAGSYAQSYRAPKRPRPIQRRNWLMIALCFLTVMVVGPGSIAALAWEVVAPASFASRMLDDDNLASRATNEQDIFQVLINRANHGDAEAMYYVGQLYDPEAGIVSSTVPVKDVSLAVAWYQKAAAQQNLPAERSLGIDYYFGRGVARDFTVAAHLFEPAAGQGDPAAEFYLGVLLENGQGEPQDLRRAVSLEETAAAAGEIAAETEVGNMYFNGIGLPMDAAKAQTYWVQAAAQGDVRAQGLLAENHMNGN